MRVCLLLEKTVALKIEDAYSELKALLLKTGCRVIAEEPPVHIAVRQGSVWGVTTRSAKKEVRCRLSRVGNETQIACSSTLASDWINITLLGFVLSGVLLSLCTWISLDLEAFLATRKTSFWSWIGTTNGFVDVQKIQLFASLTIALAVFLAVSTAVEVVIVFYARSRIDQFAEDTLKRYSSAV